MKFSELRTSFAAALRRWRADLKALGLGRAKWLVFASLALFALQNYEVVYYIAQNSDSRPVIRAFDDDAGNAIDVTGRSRWVTDNGFASYGPVYFRITSTLSTFLTPMADPGGLPPAEARTRADHFALMLTSLFAVAALSLLLASLLTRETSLLVMLAAAFEWALLHSKTWQYLILKAHPDQTLGLVVALACLASLRHWQDPERGTFRRLSAWGWGVALATKASVVFFTPFVGLAFLWHQTRARVRASFEYVGHVALAYFVIGFPQNFNVPRLYRFLSTQKNYSKPATAESVREWFTLWSDQLLMPLAIGLVVLAVTRFPRRPKVSEGLAAAALALAPFVLLLPQKILPPHAHYPIPIVAAQLTLLLALFGDPRVAFPRWFARGLVVAIPSFFYVFGLVPRGFDELLAAELQCRSEARQVFHDVLERTGRGEQLYLDPYTPASSKMPGVSVNWRTTKAWVAEKNFDTLVLNRPYYSRYFDKDKKDYIDVYNADTATTKAFYDLFENSPTHVEDPILGRWARKSTVCQWETWVRER